VETGGLWATQGVVHQVHSLLQPLKGCLLTAQIKRVFGFAKVRYRGLAKNTLRLWVSCGPANLFIVRQQLLRT
jgi:IS5 family transposase